MARWAAQAVTAVATLVLWAMVAFGQATGSTMRDTDPIYIEFQADGHSCVVRGTSIRCIDVLSHLRNVVKAPAGTQVRFNVSPSAPFEPVWSVIEEVRKSEYRTPVGYLAPGLEPAP